MRHILKVSAWHPYVAGVSGIFVLEQCRALRSYGNKVGLIFSRFETLRNFSLSRMSRGFPSVIRLDDPVPTIGFKSWCLPKAKRLSRKISILMLDRLYDAYVDEWGVPDILHGHVGIEGGLAAWRIAVRTGIPYVVTEHSSAILERTLTAEETSLLQKIYKNARRVIAVSEPLANNILNICPEAKISVIGNVVSDSVFKKRKLRNTEDRTLRAVSVSNLVSGKRLDNAIEALASLPESLKSRLSYVIIGDGPERGRLEKLAVARHLEVDFRGTLPHDEAMSVLSAGDFLLHPSVMETFGIVIAEALALGMPVVACRSGGPETFVGPHEGIIVRPDSIEEMSTAVQAIAANIEYWRQRGDDLSKYAEGKFSESVIAELIVGTY